MFSPKHIVGISEESFLTFQAWDVLREKCTAAVAAILFEYKVYF